jgi:2-polyprenyl-3-methyl-5-hydroxy-6-metoxy-1,4-benzoquinol methylase
MSQGYILATGTDEVKRLQLLNQLYGPGTEGLLWRAGLKPGMQVVDIGCGSGNMSCWLAQQVGEGGSVIGVDVSPAQIEQARLQAQSAGLSNVTFVVADAYAPGLTADSFDLVYSRLVLMHLSRPLEALQQMQALLKPGGRLVCEEMDLTQWLHFPRTEALVRMNQLNLALGDRRGQHFRLGTSLYQLFLKLGFDQPEVSVNMPVSLRGESKRLIDLTFAQFAPALVKEALATEAEVADLTLAIQQFTDDPTALLGMPMMGQAWAVKS